MVMTKPFSIFEFLAGSAALAPVALIAFFGLRVPQSQVSSPDPSPSLSTASISPAESPIQASREQLGEQSQNITAVGNPHPVEPGSASDKPIVPEPSSAEVAGSQDANRPLVAAAWRLGRWRSDDAARVKQRWIEAGLLWGFAGGAQSQIAPSPDDQTAEAAVAPSPPVEQNVEQNRPRRDSRSENTFIGGWADDTDECRQSQNRRALLVISAHAARTASAKCDFQSVRREAASRWHIVAQCSREGESWSAHVDLNLAGANLTWSSERGTATYVRCLKL
jgi:hypothetical protein